MSRPFNQISYRLSPVVPVLLDVHVLRLFVDYRTYDVLVHPRSDEDDQHAKHAEEQVGEVGEIDGDSETADVVGVHERPVLKQVRLEQTFHLIVHAPNRLDDTVRSFQDLVRMSVLLEIKENVPNSCVQDALVVDCVVPDAELL